MYIDLKSQSKLQPYVKFDWRLVAERGLRCYGHFHESQRELRSVASCELGFLIKAANEENAQLPKGLVEDIICSTTTKHSGTSSTKPVGQFKCVGGVRKAGFLSVKKWILKRRQSIELARKQGWKRYWVCLRGTALLFHSVVDNKEASKSSNCTNLLSWVQTNCAGHMQTLDSLLQEECEQQGEIPRETLLANMSHCYIEEEPRHLIIIEGAIAQPIPEHPKRDHVFCLSTTFGDAYLFQSACQLESDNWISAIHNACAASIARDLNRDEATKLFQTKIRHLEMETDKKLFLKHRLESRLTSMSSMSHINSITYSSNQVIDTDESQEVKAKKMTLRTLLYRLHQQLLSLEIYLEQVHCEIYQLRCYLSSCGLQTALHQLGVRNQASPSFLSIDLPHPKSLLMHVSKTTKLLLIKLGVFTVSSFHAYIHARQGSARSLLQKIKQVSSMQQNNSNTSPLELRVRSHSISEALLAKSSENVELETDSEQLIHLSNLKAISVRVKKKLFAKIRCTSEEESLPQTDSDDRYSLHEDGNYAIVNMKMHSNSNTMSIIKQVLGLISQDLNELAFLDYYLLLRVDEESPRSSKQEQTSGSKPADYVAKRRETLNDWSNYKYLELMEKIIFRVELTRARLDEDSAPFGISINAQLFSSQTENLLIVYCSYIEWGSVADRAGLKDEDEFLAINGVPVMDLDMMFIECLIQDETKLKLVVRSSRTEGPEGSTSLLDATWRRDSNQDELDGANRGGLESTFDAQQFAPNTGNIGSQVISDEYISSLVCPPPPSHSNAFLRTDSSLVRQKSDVGPKVKVASKTPDILQNNNIELSRLSTSTTIPSLACDGLISKQDDSNSKAKQVKNMQLSSANLADQLLRKTEQLTRLLGRTLVEPSWVETEKNLTLARAENINAQPHSTTNKSDLNTIERLRKSILELLETEFAYIRHLETISEHYMNPLDDISYLNIADLKHLSHIVSDLSLSQKRFLGKLIGDISADCDFSSLNVSDEFEELDKIVKQLDSFKNVGQFRPILQSITRTFLGESDKFKIYASYCVAYSRLQKLLHPKSNQTPVSSLIGPVSHTLDVFLTSSSMRFNKVSSNGYASNHRDYLKPFNSLINSTSESNSQLKQLGEFLGNLDSSSSSVSLSLSKSSVSASNGSDQKRSQKSNQSSANRFQRSIHQQNFESYLIKPIQRIVKYPMLLNSIAMAASVSEDIEVQNALQTVVKRMESIASHVNDTQRINEEYGMIFHQIERQFTEVQANEQLKSNNPTSTGPHQPPISLGVDQLLYSGPVDWLNIHEFTSKIKKGMHLIHTLFVFNSCVVFISKERVKAGKKEHQSSTGINTITDYTTFPKSHSDLTEIIRYQSLIPVSEVQVRSVPSSSEQSRKEDRFQWELFRCSSVNSNSSLLTKSRKRNTRGNVYLLSCSSNETRNTFLRRIRYIIRESVRNMSLPLVRSPSSKSITPKKLSSPSSNTNSSCSQSTSLNPVCNSRNESKEIKDKIDCRFRSQVDEKFTTTIQVNN